MNDELQQKAKEIAIKHVKAMLKELSTEVVLPVVTKKVQESSTKIDDMLLPIVTAAVTEALEKI